MVDGGGGATCSNAMAVEGSRPIAKHVVELHKSPDNLHKITQQSCQAHKKNKFSSSFLVDFWEKDFVLEFLSLIISLLGFELHLMWYVMFKILV